MRLPVVEKVLHCHLEQKKGKHRKMLSEYSCFGMKKKKKKIVKIENLFNQEILGKSKDTFY